MALRAATTVTQAAELLQAAVRGGASVDALALAWQLDLATRDDQRRRRGAFYTPASLAATLVEQALEQLPHPPGVGNAPRVLEPACGAGVMILCWIDALERRGVAPGDVAAAVHAWDSDPVAVALTRLSVERRWGPEVAALLTLCCVDALAPDPSEGRSLRPAFDVIIGNPPFGNAIGQATGRGQAEREAHQLRFPLAARGAYDKASLFLELADQLLDDDGVLALVLPLSLLAGPAAAALRAELHDRRGLRAVLHVTSVSVFAEAQVHVAAVVIGGARLAGPASTSDAVRVVPWPDPLTGDEARRPAKRIEAAPGVVFRRLVDPAAWGSLLSPWHDVASLAVPGLVRLDERLDIRASAAAAEAYAWQASVRELVPAAHGAASPPAFRLVVSGSIEPMRIDWGARPTRYLGARFQRPVLDAACLSATRLQQASSPKALVAGLSAVIECAPDESGAFVGAVATLTVMLRDPAAEASPALIRRVAAVLNGVWVRAQYLAMWGALRLGGGSVQVSRDKLGQLRAPAAWFLEPSQVADAGAAAIPALHAAGRVPTEAFLTELVARALELAADRPAAACIGLLDGMLRDDPVGAVESGRADVCLLAAAPALTLAIRARLRERSAGPP